MILRTPCGDADLQRSPIDRHTHICKSGLRSRQIAEDLLDPLFHQTGIGRLVVTVANQVEYAVDEEIEDHFLIAVTQILRVIRCSVNAYDDVSENVRPGTGLFLIGLGK